ncbi:hypothetical protein ACFFK0_23025 [Paenibacillus chartarius]|uniref:Uncharacterized protein n=1 Tax=Paenibacillus chartarius TaxID=747481 RepID=A0ABV6DRK3_9BACL
MNRKANCKKKCTIIKKTTTVKVACTPKPVCPRPLCKKKKKLVVKKKRAAVKPRVVVNRRIIVRRPTITVPVPQVNVEAPDVTVAPAVIPAPVVNVSQPDNACETELRLNLLRYRGTTIEVIDPAFGGSPLNRIGVLESVGEGTFAIRPTTDNPTSEVVYYSICQIVGFRPEVTVPSPAPIG